MWQGVTSGVGSRRLGAVLGGVALAAGGLVLGVTPAGAAPITETFDSEPGDEFTVPAGVCEIDVDAFGGQGGAADDTGGGAGGMGGRATATIPVIPGEVLIVRVAGAGDPASAGGFGGANGGGNGGVGTSFSGGGGGGAS